MNLFITGGSGYLSSALRQALTHTNHSWYTLTRDTHLVPISSREQLLIGSVENLPFPKAPIDAVIHLIGLAGDQPCRENPELAQRLNFESTKLVARSARAHGVRHFLFPSTTSVYDHGQSTTDTFDEQSTADPGELYAKTKLAAEQWLRQESGLPNVTVLRLPCIYGESPVMHFDTFIHLFLRQAQTSATIPVFDLGQRELWRPTVALPHVLTAIEQALISSLAGFQLRNVVTENQPIRIYAKRIAALAKTHGRNTTLTPLPRPTATSYRVGSQDTTPKQTEEQLFLTQLEAVWQSCP